MKISKLILLTSVLALGSTMAFGAQATGKTTADSQMQGTAADVAITRKIRDRLTDMEGLSMRAQNVTIVTEGNNVTLKGEVDKQEEIQKIMNVAKEEASGKTVQNQLSVHK